MMPIDSATELHFAKFAKTIPMPPVRPIKPMKTDDLDALSDNALSEAFAMEVAGWTHNPKHGHWCFSRPHPIAPDTRRHGDFNFATSADAVLVHLYKHHWTVDQTSNEASPIRVRLGHSSGPFGESDRFPRAAVIALLRHARAQKGQP